MEKKIKSPFRGRPLVSAAILSICFLSTKSVYADSSLLVVNSPKIIAKEEKTQVWMIDPKPQALPRNWRVMEWLRASGSGQFSKLQFEGVIKELRKKYKFSQFIDVDLRQESHGFLDDYAVSWYSDHNSINWGKSKSEIARSELEALQSLLKQKKGIVLSQFLSKETDDPDTTDRIAFWKKKQVKVDSPKKVMTEQQMVSEDSQVIYLRIPVADMHAPEDREVDQFIDEMKKVRPNQWVHFHCSAGRGRTTTFMAMYDSFRNFSKVSLKEILRKQKEMGGVDLVAYSLKRSKSRNDWAEQRAQFIAQFYRYCQSEGPSGYRRSWSAWKDSQSH